MLLRKSLYLDTTLDHWQTPQNLQEHRSVGSSAGEADGLGAAPSLYSGLACWQSSKQPCCQAQHEAPMCRCTLFANRKAEFGGQLPIMCTA